MNYWQVSERKTMIYKCDFAMYKLYRRARDHMKKFLKIICLITVTMCLFAGCGYENKTDTSDISENSDAPQEASDSASESDTDTPNTEAADKEEENEMRIKVTDGNHEVTFRLNDGSAAKSLYEQLPLTVGVENYGSNEKIFYPPEKFDTSDVIEGGGSAGMLAYFSPWGDVVMYYSSFGSYPGLYLLGEAVEGAENIENLSGTITITVQ